jgi:hypothetical protein
MTKYVAIVKIRGSPAPPIVIKIGKFQDGAAAIIAFTSRGNEWRRWLLQRNVEEIVFCQAEDAEEHLAAFREAIRRPP